MKVYGVINGEIREPSPKEKEILAKRLIKGVASKIYDAEVTFRSNSKSA